MGDDNREVFSGGPDFRRTFAELLACRETLDPGSFKYENALKTCAHVVQEASTINLRLTRLDSKDAETLVTVLEWALDVSKLEVLDLSRNFITDSVVLSLCRILSSGRFTGLECLDLSHNSDCRMGMESSRALAEVFEAGHLSGLRSLGLPSCHVPTIAAGMLKGNVPKLQELQLQFNRKLTQSSFELRSFFEKGVLTDLRILVLRDCLLTDEQVESLARIIQAGKVFLLETLNLSYNLLKRAGCTSLSRGIRLGQLPNLKCLDLNWCHMGDTGVQQILDCIHKLPLLEFLSLKNNEMTDIGTAVLAEVMKKKSLFRVKEIRLSGRNMITNEGIVALATALGESGSVPNLHTLDLGTQKTLEFIGARAVVNAYRRNPNLTVFVEVSWPSESLRIRTEEQRKRNKRAEGIHLDLKDEEVVDQTTAKVFLCGYEKMGKTTLRESLGRTLLKSLVKWERKPMVSDGHRTRGIELSHIPVGDTLNLVLWDLAGQQDFHVLHGAFLPDRGLASGRATTFVLVFRANFEQIVDSENALLYWLRFISSGSVKGLKRHVVLVLNCMDSRTHGGISSFDNHVKYWRALLKQFNERFFESLDIVLEPFVLDARRRSSVQDLKQHLKYHVASALKDVKIPKICVGIQEFLRDWATDNSQFPVLSWADFSKEMKARGHSAKKIDAAAAHLQESGDIIYYKDQSIDETVMFSGSGFVVADPEWFCRRVVGQLLLPEGMLEKGESHLNQLVGSDGSLKVAQLLEYFDSVVTSSRQANDFIDMLGRVGLCFKVADDRVFIPALIKEDDLTMWDGKGVRWVLGRCLATKVDSTAAIPSSVFRRLQVVLAQDKRFGMRGDSKYCAGRSYSCFKVGLMMVLIQFDADESDADDDRLDVLVQDLVETENVESIHPVDLILQIMDLVERLCIQSCPGVEFDRKVIKPWNAKDPSTPMAKRELLLVDELKMRIQEHGLGMTTSWQVGLEAVREDQLLSPTELDAIQSSIQQRLQIAEADVVNFGLLAPSFKREDDEAALLELTEQDECTSEYDHIVAVVREEAQKIRDHIDNKMAELAQKFDKAFEKQNTLLNQILNLHRFSIEEKERSVPRYIFLAKRGAPSVWISARQAFHEQFQLHLLCECRYDDGVPHSVEGQEGLEIKSTREWLRHVAPWLIWSLKVAIVVARIVGNIFAPGIGVMIPGFDNGGDSSKLAESIEKMAIETKQALSRPDTISPGGTVTQIAEAVVSQLIREVGRVKFVQQIGLRRVALSPKENSLQQPAVVWICEECFSLYSRTSGRIRDITPYD